MGIKGEGEELLAAVALLRRDLNSSALLFITFWVHQDTRRKRLTGVSDSSC